LAKPDKSALGLGGMLSKLTYARLATRLGIRVVFFAMRTENAIPEALAGRLGTVFLPQPAQLNARQKWLLSGSLIAGRLTLDAGAVKAIQQRKSLLAVGVSRVKGPFEKSEVIELLDTQGRVIAIARTRHDASTITQHLHTQNFEIAHADEIVLL
jgi:glutamate 5-kinase